MKARPIPPFASDMSAESSVRVRTVRSPVAKGRILSVGHPGLPPGYSLILPSDIPGKQRLGVLGADLPVLAGNSVSYPGEPIALLCGPDPLELEALASDVKIEFEDEWPLFSFESFSSDQILRVKRVEHGDVEAALAASPLKIERTYRTGSQEHYYPEPLSAFASLEYDKIVIRTATQWPFHVRSSVAAALGIREEDVVVRPTEAGMNMDGKLWYPSLIAVHAALACLISKQPAMLSLDREEDFRYSPKRTRTAISLRAGAGADGKLLALDVQVLIDLGAYGVLAEEILERTCGAVPGPYACPCLKIEGYAIQTNTLPLGPFAGMGMAASSFAMESLVSELALVAGSDPVELRRMNLGGNADPGKGRKERRPRARASLDALWPPLSEASDFPRKYSSYELLRKRGASREEGPLRGIGLSFGFQGNGFLAERGAEEASVECLLSKDLCLSVRTSAILTNPGTALLWKRMASAILGIPESSVSIADPSTDLVPNSGPSTLSRNVTLVSALVGKCAEEIQKSRFRSPLPLSARKVSRPAKRSRSTGVEGPDSFSAPSFGMAAVEVELDSATAEPRVSGVWMAVDAGEIVHADFARLALLSGAAAALAWASSESIEFADGRVADHIFWRYAIPRADEMPPISVFFPDSPCTSSPRGLGELPFILLPSAYARALSQASGFDADSLPVGIDRMIKEELDS
jgi:CO/xanthine dehydrogenase Mo-binding subunit